MPEAAPSVGGGAPTGPDQPGPEQTGPDQSGPDQSGPDQPGPDQTDQNQPAGLAGGSTAAAARFVDALLVTAQELDPLGFQGQLDLAAAAQGLARCIDQVLLPSIHHLQGMLAQGRCNAAQQLMATEAVRTWLDRRGSFAPPPRESAPIVLACGPRDRDVVGLECLALLLRMRRRACRVLGARTSIFTLTIAARAADAGGVVVVSTEERNLPQAVAALRAVQKLGIPLFFVGTAFDRAPGRQRLPGRYLGRGIEGACGHLVRTLATNHRAVVARP